MTKGGSTSSAKPLVVSVKKTFRDPRIVKGQPEFIKAKYWLLNTPPHILQKTKG
jgi:hypothetical protein